MELKNIFLCLVTCFLFFSCKHRGGISSSPSNSNSNSDSFSFFYQGRGKEKVDLKKVHSSILLPAMNSKGIKVDWESSHPFILNPKTGDLRKPYYENLDITLSAKKRGTNTVLESMKLTILGENKRVCPEASLVWRDNLCWYISSLLLFFYGSHNKIFLEMLWKDKGFKDARESFMDAIFTDIETIISPRPWRDGNSCMVSWDFQEFLNNALRAQNYEILFQNAGAAQTLNGPHFANALALVLFFPEIKNNSPYPKKKYSDTRQFFFEGKGIVHRMNYSGISFDFSSTLFNQGVIKPEELAKIISQGIAERLSLEETNLSKKILESSLKKRFFLVELANYDFSNALHPPRVVKVGGETYFLSNVMLRSSMQDAVRQIDTNGHYTNYMRCENSWKYYDSMFGLNHVRSITPQASELWLPQEVDASGRIVALNISSETLLLYTR